MAWLRGLWMAVGFLSRCPVPHVAAQKPTDLLWAQFWFPAVGLGLGACLWAVAWGGTVLLLDAGVLAAVLVAVLAAGTGALHLDGVADTVDGFSGGRDRESRLRIMRDSRIGAHGGVALTLILLTKYALFSAWLQRPLEVAGMVLLVALPFGRAILVAVICWFPYAREDGLGAGFKAASRSWAPLIACLWLAPLLMLPFWRTALLGLLVASVALLMLARGISRRLGGLSGDTYGALLEFGEVAGLLALLSAQAAG